MYYGLNFRCLRTPPKNYVIYAIDESCENDRRYADFGYGDCGDHDPPYDYCENDCGVRPMIHRIFILHEVQPLLWPPRLKLFKIFLFFQLVKH